MCDAIRNQTSPNFFARSLMISRTASHWPEILPYYKCENQSELNSHSDVHSFILYFRENISIISLFLCGCNDIISA